MLEAIWFPEEILYVINPISNRIRFRGLYFNYDLKGNISSVDETDFEADHYLGLEFQLTGGGTTDRVYVTPLSQRTTTFKLRNGVDHPETDGRIWKIIDARWDGSPSTADDYATVFDYYSDGNLKSIKYPDGPSSHIGPKITYTYDDFDNVIMVSDQLGNEWKAVFDQKDRLIESEDARGEKQYFDFQDGFLSQVHTPPNLGPSGEQSKPLGDGRIGRTSTMTYDYQGRLADVDSDVSASNQQKRVEYGYTGFGELHTLGRLISGFPKVTSWSYDQLGRVVQMTDTLGRLSTRSYEPFCTEYDSTSARGVEMKQTFDNLCRPKLTLAGSKNIERFYNHRQLLTRIEQRRFLSYGQALFGSDNYGDYSDQVYEFEYDEFNRLEKVEYPDGKNIRYTYGAANEILSVRDSEDRITRYEYNNDLSLRKVILDRSSNPPSHHGKEVQYEYDLAGRVKKIIYSDGIQIHYDDGGSPLASGWNENGQLTHIRYLKTGGSGLQLLRSYQYEYDDSGNRVRTVESNGTLSQDVEWLYRYDWLDRLVQVKRGLGGATPVIQREYVFDESDNRIYLDDYINNQTFWYTYKTVGTGTDTKYSDELDEVFIATGTGKRVPTDLSDFSSFETFQSDADGNITSRTNSSGTTKYSWNAFNDLVSVRLDDGTKSVNFYGPDSIREEALKNDGERVNSFYSGLSTIDENSSVNGSTGYFMGHQLMGFERNGNSYWFLTDGLTSVRSLIDDNGNEVATFEHDEFGNELDVTGSISSPKTWIGGLGVHDDSDESRLLYMRRRHYDPSLGRFLNRDPIGFAGGLNLFSYGANNPVTFVDHTGLQPGFYPPGTGPYINEYTPEGDSYRFRDEGRSKLYRDLDYSNDALYWEDTQDVGGRPTNYSQMEGKNTYEPPKKGKLPKGCLSKVLKRLGPLGAAYGIGSALSNIANAEEQDRCSVAACEAVDAVIPIDLLRALFQPRHPHQRREFNHNPSFHNLDIPPRSVRPR
jgi:RHS repeat-associated protein